MNMFAQSIYCYDNANNYCLSDIMAFNPRKIRDTLPQDGNGVVATYTHNYHSNYCYDYAVFNPTNSNEFIYLRQEPIKQSTYSSYLTFDKWELWKMDICTGICTCIMTNLVNTDYVDMAADFRISYGKNGYLLPIPNGKKLGMLDANIYNFIPLSKKISPFSPCRWNSKATHFFYQVKHSYSLTTTYFATKDQITVDSLTLGAKFIDWGDDLIVYANNYNVLKTYSLSKKEHKTILNLFVDKGLNGYAPLVPIWLKPDTSVLWYNQYKMGITNIYTQKTDTILTMGDNVYIQHVDVSPDHKKIIGTFVQDEYFSIRPVGLNRKMSIIIMNIDGTEMKEIVIPK